MKILQWPRLTQAQLLTCETGQHMYLLQLQATHGHFVMNPTREFHPALLLGKATAAAKAALTSPSCLCKEG